jgi:hypothetical protein
MIVRTDIYKSNGGRASRDTWSNSYYFAIDADLNSTEVRQVVTTIKDAEVLSHLGETHFMRAKAYQIAENTFNRPDKRFVTMEFDDVGARNIVNVGVIVGTEQPDRSNPRTAKDICVVVNRQCSEGHNGRLFYRNCLLMDDIKSGSDGKFVTVPFVQGSTLGLGQNAMIDALNATLPNGAIFVMPNHPGYFSVVTTARTVVEHTFGGIAILKTTRRRRTVTEEQRYLDQRKLNEIGHAANALLKGLLPAALSGASATAFAALVAEATTFMAALPAGEAAMLALPAVLLL